MRETKKEILEFIGKLGKVTHFSKAIYLSKKFIVSFGDVPVNSITPKMVSDLFLEEIKRCKLAGLGNSRSNEPSKAMRTTINHARNYFGAEVHDPTRGIKKLPKDIKTHFITTEEMIHTVCLA